MAHELSGYGNVKVAGSSAWALRPATEHSRSYITGGSAGCPIWATGCQMLLKLAESFDSRSYIAQVKYGDVLQGKQGHDMI